MKFSVLMIAMLAALIAACSSAPPETETTEPDPVGIDLHFAFETPAGTETHWCEFVRLPENDGKPINAAGFKWTSDSFHHWSFFRTVGTTAETPVGTPFQCFGSPETAMADLVSIVSQPTGPADELLFPAGYAVPFEPGEVLMLQAHTINVSAEIAHPTIDLSIILADADVQALGEFQFYDPFLVVPAFGEGHASMRCKVPAAIDMVRGETHQHTRGVSMEVFLDLPGEAPSDKPILSQGSWEDPDVFNEVLHVPAGATFRVFCDYEDKTGEAAYQGPTRDTSEMCQFFGYYSAPDPSPAAVLWEACVPSFVPGGTGDMHGTGDKTCGETLACVSGCSAADAPKIVDGKFDVGACWQQCQVAACPSAGETFNPAFGCVSGKCAVECGAGVADPACQACIGANCGAEVGACQAAMCAAL